MTTFKTVGDVKRANQALGHHWFDRDTMSFFNSRVQLGDALIGGRYFISSEQFDADSERRYTIRRAFDDGSVDTAGEFMGYATREEAKRAAAAL